MTISVVIPTIGRPSLPAAIDSALAQSTPVDEVIVVADTVDRIDDPEDSRVRVLRVGPFSGSANARQAGIEAARGDVIALLDDDDLWHPYKIERQLAGMASVTSQHWVSACRCAVRVPGHKDKVWPREPICDREPVAEYLFQLHGFSMGGGMLQTSTLCFPRSLALDVPLNLAPDAIHDEPTWLMSLQEKLPDTIIRQIPDCLSIYNVTGDSMSRRTEDLSGRYLEWGEAHLRDSSARVRGDYYLTSAVTAAAAARSPEGIRRAIRTGFTHGRPGAGAIAYALAKLAVASVPGRVSAGKTHDD